MVTSAQEQSEAKSLNTPRPSPLAPRPSPQQGEAKFMDMQAAVGVTKHIGGAAATDELLDACHVGPESVVLNVGCGIGAGPTYVVKRRGCRVVGVDIAEQMTRWAQQRVRSEGVAASIDLAAADVLALPFAPGLFDAVICESVLIFVPDKVQAIRECVRVTRPGGYVGLNEGFWFGEPTPAMAAKVKTAIGPAVPTLAEWQALWEQSGLDERSMKTYRIDARQEVRSRIQWIGWRWLLPAWGRALRLYLANPQVRQAIKDQFDVSTEIMESIGYGLWVGRRQAENDYSGG